MDIYQLTVELSKSLAWPIVASGTIYLLRDNLSGLFKNGLKSIKHGDTEVSFESSQDQTKSPSKAIKANLEDFAKLMPPDTTGLQENTTKVISKALGTAMNDEKKIEVLTAHLAELQIKVFLKDAYVIIFGSQIRLLEYLNVQPSKGSAMKEIEVFFHEFKEMVSVEKAKKATFSAYIQFLTDWDFVKLDNDKFQLTQAGESFLNFMVSERLNKNKAY